MRNEPTRSDPAMNLEDSLQRLGVTDLQERLELSPLLAGDGVGEADGCRCTCECDSSVPEQIAPDAPPMPDAGGFGLGLW